MNKYVIGASLTGLGLLAGLYIGYGKNNLIKALSCGIGGGFLVGAPIAFYYDTEKNGHQNIIKDLQGTVARTTNEKTTEFNQKIKAENLKNQVLEQVINLKKDLDIRKNSETELLSKSKLFEARVLQLEQKCLNLSNDVRDKEAELEVFNEDYHKNLVDDFETKKREVVGVEIAKEFELTTEAFQLMEEMETFVKQVYERHQGQREQLLGTNGKYQQHFENTVSHHNEAYYQLEQIRNSLELRIRVLEQTITEGLISPIYTEAGFNKLAETANKIARDLFEDFNMPLIVQGYNIRPDGVHEIGYGYGKTANVESIVSTIQGYSKQLVESLKIHKITSVRKLELADCVVISFRREPALKDKDADLMVGSPQEFLEYITSQPIRYRLIADPGTGKTPTTAVMVSALIKEGGTMGNTGKGAKIPHMLVDVSYPDATNSQKDLYYPLEPFLKYGTTTAAIKSFSDASDDWEYRKRDTHYAAKFFQLWVWDELDNTLNSCTDPKAAGETLKEILKQAHHTGVGFIVSGQSVMTKQIPGFMNDDRSLFTEIIIGIPKIRMYLQAYGKARNSQKKLDDITKNLDDLEDYIEAKNRLVIDTARELRVALVVDSRSPKLYYLPNLDLAKFDTSQIAAIRDQSTSQKRAILANSPVISAKILANNSQKPLSVSTDQNGKEPSFPTIGGSGQNGTIPHCPHCTKASLNLLSDGRYRCLACKSRFVQSKAVWK